MFLVGIIIFAENHILQVALLVYQRQRVDLVIPDDIVAVMQAGVGRCGNQLVQRGHELSHFQIGAHAGQAVVTGCHNAQQLAVGGAVSVMATVEWPVRVFRSNTSARVASGGRLESEVTKPFL